MITWIKTKWLSFNHRMRLKVEINPLGADDIRKCLRKRFKAPNCEIEIEDTIYYTCDRKMAILVSKLVPIYLIRYRKNEFDCDNFSRLFWGVMTALFPRLPVGRVNCYTKQGKHSLNFIIYTYKGQPRFSFIEPQTGKMSNFNYKPYLLIV